MKHPARAVKLASVIAHEHATYANVRLGGYWMNLLAPLDEMSCHYVTLDHLDAQRMFLLQDFRFCTTNISCRVTDLLPEGQAVAMEAAPHLPDNQLDLRKQRGLELLLVGLSFDSPLLVIDGNHRTMAHWYRHGSLEGVNAYLGLHPRIIDWEFIPPLFRVDVKRNEAYATSSNPRS